LISCQPNSGGIFVLANNTYYGAAVEEELSSELRRLRYALEAVSADLDAIEQRPHPLLRLAAEKLAGGRTDRLETCVSHFVFAVQRGELR
jgi:hypothetical protein